MTSRMIVCPTSPPSGNQVDGLPLVFSLAHLGNMAVVLPVSNWWPGVQNLNYFWISDNSIGSDPIFTPSKNIKLWPDRRRASDHGYSTVKAAHLCPTSRLEKLKKIEIFDNFQICSKLDPGGPRTFKTSKNDENCDLGPPKIENLTNFEKNSNFDILEN